MRCNDVVQMLRGHVFTHREIQRVERHVATGVNDGCLTVIDNEKLIGLYRLCLVGHQIGKHDAAMLRTFEEFNCHGGAL